MSFKEEEGVLSHFKSQSSFVAVMARWSDDERTDFSRLMHGVHMYGMDIWHSSKNPEAIIFGRRGQGKQAWKRVAIILCRTPFLVRMKRNVGKYEAKNDYTMTPDFVGSFLGAIQTFRNTPDWSWLSTSRSAFWPDQLEPENEDQPTGTEFTAGGYEKPVSADKEEPALARNMIFYGPPGTGKTHGTVNAALELLDPVFLAANAKNRDALKQRFDELAESGHIHFVTFHQSFSYEDFVEGIRANATEEGGGLEYSVEPGVFKTVCEAARSRVVTEGGTGIDVSDRRIWKLSLGDAQTEGHIYEQCMANGCALLGFGSGVDLTGAASRQDIADRLKAAGQEGSGYPATALNVFVRQMKPGDLILVTEGNLKFRAIGEITGDYQFVDSEDREYTHSRPVRWLRQYSPGRPYQELTDKRFSQMTVYEPSAIKRDRLAALLDSGQAEVNEPEARVLIIDEINRGNVSRIFGELITLIEPSKREGQKEALSVTLPYSKERFSVPSNLHLIGTMNTADRSLASLDVALRRRFEFIELPPRPELLAGLLIEGIDVAQMLTVMNQRISVLLGRDYQIGHAWFMGLNDAPSMPALAKVFRRQVIPLLQEYFYEDWQKIAWVLNDHRKGNAPRFLTEPGLESSALFGEGIDLPGLSRLWQLDDNAFDDPAAYIGIYRDVPVAQA